MMPDVVRIAAVGDLHCTKTSAGELQPLFAQMAESADVLALCGDLVDYGLADETHVLVKELAGVLKSQVRVLAVLGNHDFEAGDPERLKRSCARLESPSWTEMRLSSREEAVLDVLV